MTYVQNILKLLQLKIIQAIIGAQYSWLICILLTLIDLMAFPTCEQEKYSFPREKHVFSKFKPQVDIVAP